jgi:hypothetical protein
MDPVGNEHHYTITRRGRSHLIKHEGDTADDSIASLTRIREQAQDKEAFKKLEATIERLSESVARLEEDAARPLASTDVLEILASLLRLKNRVSRAVEAGLVPIDTAAEWRQAIISIDTSMRGLEKPHDRKK